MTLFLENCLAFPVFMFTGLLLIVILYWCMTILGLFEIDAGDIVNGSDGLDVEGIAGLLIKIGLGGVPAIIVLTFFSLFGWLLSFIISQLVLRHIDITLIRYALGAVALMATTLGAVFLTSLFVRPLRSLFRKLNVDNSHKVLIGQTVIVTSPVVSNERGYANFNDGGAGLILQVRTDKENSLQRGDRAVILSYDEATHSYHIIGENEFRGL